MMARRKKEVKIFTLDTETYGLDGLIKRIAIYDGVDVHLGYKFSDVEHVLIKASKQYKVVVYIHNMDFDLRKMPSVFENNNVRWNMTKVINNKYVRLVCNDYTFCDSFRLLPMALDTICKEFKIENAKIDLMDAVNTAYPGKYVDKLDYFINCDVDDPVYLEYLKYDVISLYEVIFKLSDISGIPIENLVMCLSTASMSKYVFKKGYKGIIPHHENCSKSDYDYLIKNKYWASEKNINYSNISYLELENKIRLAYFGGRTEVFIPRIGNGFHYDVNSLYPYVCSINQYPIGVPEYMKETMASFTFNQWLKYHKGLGYITAKVFIPKQFIPPLPVKKEKLCFLCGYIEGTWTFNELEYAIKQCGVRVEKIIECIYFSETFPVFENFMNLFFKLKVEGKTTGNKALTQFAKLMLNTAYGWTGLRRDDKTQLDFLEFIDKYDSEKIVTVNEKLGYVEAWSQVFSESIQVQIAGYVTSYARLYLLDNMRKIIDRGGKIYYCDTDSIVTDIEMEPEMVDSKALGLWDCEAIIKEGIFLQPKVYFEICMDKGIAKFKGRCKTKFKTFNVNAKFKRIAISRKNTRNSNVKFKGISKARQKALDVNVYDELFDKLKDGDDEKYLIEKDFKTLGSLIVAQKNHVDANKLNVRDKYLNLGNIQKRNIDYKNNTSTPWFMESYDYFNNLKFSNQKKLQPSKKRIY